MPNYKMNICTSRIKLIGIAIISIICVTVLLVHEVSAKGNLARRAERLPELKIDAAKGFSIKKYLLETGKYYRWRIISDGRDEYSFVFPKLSRNIWIGQVVIEDKEVKPFGGILWNLMMKERLTCTFYQFVLGSTNITWKTTVRAEC